MSVAFNQLGDPLTSLFFAEFNAGLAPYSGQSCQLLIGHKLSTGTATVGQRIPLGGSDPVALFGPGSMLADQALHARRSDPLGQIFCLPCAEPSTPTAATGIMTIAGPATANGTFTRYIAGQRVDVTFKAGDNATTMAAAFVAKVAEGFVKFNRRMFHPVTAANVAGAITFTARHGGVIGNSIRIDAGLMGDESDPAGVTATLSSVTATPTGGTLTGGAGNFDLAAGLALLGPSPAEWITGPWNSTAQLDAVRDFLANTGSGRWSPTVQRGGHYVTSREDTFGNLQTFGTGRNDAHATVVGTREMPNSPWVIAAAINGLVARSKNMGFSASEAVEIARPLQTLLVEGLMAPAREAARWEREDRETLYRSGIAAYTASRENTVHLERMVTTWQRNAYGTADRTFLDLETLAISQYVGRYMRQRIEGLYPRHVLLDENPRNLQGVVTPRMAKNSLIHAYAELCDAGVAENAALFNAKVVCERSSDPNRLNAFLPVDVANQLRVFAANITIYPQMTEALLGG